MRWAMTHYHLGNACIELGEGEQAANQEWAIEHFHAALSVFTREDSPKQWAATQKALGEAYSKRIEGERAANMEQAVAHYENALSVSAD